MAKRLILPLILTLMIIAGLLYVGSQRWVQISILATEPSLSPDQGLAMSLQSAILFACLAVVAVIVLWSLVVWLWRLPSRMKSGFGRKRETNGLDAIEEALVAGEIGDGIRARRRAHKAHELLSRPALTGLISAKTAEAAGSEDEAKTHYTALLDDPKTELAGLRGLARLATNAGNPIKAIEWAQTAFEKTKAPEWTFDALFDAQVKSNDWAGAVETLATAEKRKHVDKDVAKRQRAVLLAARAANEEKDDVEIAADTAVKAAESSGEFAPATALAAHLLSQTDQVKKATSLIERAWSKAPHPALAIAYRDMFAAEPANVMAKKVKALAKQNPNHRESAILKAEQALSENDGTAALAALGELLRSENPSARLCILAAAAEEKLDHPVDAHAWQLRAASAPIEADWSDLDPDGPGFNYTDMDWRELVTSFGKTGELIHPRYGAGKRRQVVAEIRSPQLSAKDASQNAGTTTSAPSPDDPGIIIDEGDAKDLSSRLNNLLGNSDKS